MFTAAKISTFFQTSKLFRIIVRMMSDFLYFCTHKVIFALEFVAASYQCHDAYVHLNAMFLNK